jgi:hypothetical protein
MAAEAVRSTLKDDYAACGHQVGHKHRSDLRRVLSTLCGKDEAITKLQVVVRLRRKVVSDIIGEDHRGFDVGEGRRAHQPHAHYELVIQELKNPLNTGLAIRSHLPKSAKR